MSQRYYIVTDTTMSVDHTVERTIFDRIVATMILDTTNAFDIIVVFPIHFDALMMLSPVV
jgi:hypothetical protein